MKKHIYYFQLSASMMILLGGGGKKMATRTRMFIFAVQNKQTISRTKRLSDRNISWNCFY